ncbi:ankyrin repeat protein [Diaporthe sp. PMI_573]|nr:ankyrin repeat protein [Diaporthaceae sp. PMI_573]
MERRWPDAAVARVGGGVAVVQLLLDKGANINGVDKDGGTPLWEAAGSGSVIFMRLLLDKCANINAAHEYGWTPLSYATKNGHEAVVRLLLDKGANTDRFW